MEHIPQSETMLQSPADLAMFTVVATDDQAARLQRLQEMTETVVLGGETFFVRTSQFVDQVDLMRYTGQSSFEKVSFTRVAAEDGKTSLTLMNWDASSDIKNEQQLYIQGWPFVMAGKAVLAAGNEQYNYRLTQAAQEVAARRAKNIIYGAELAYRKKLQPETDESLPLKAAKAAGRLLTRAFRG